MSARRARALLSLLVVLALAGPAWGATPTLVQIVSGPTSVSVPAAASPWTQQFAEPTQAGNLLLAFISTNSGGTMATNAVTDDQSQTWTRVINAAGGTNADGFLFTMTNTAANVRKVTCAIGVATDFVQIVLVEVRNVLNAAATLKTWTNENTAAVTSWSSGAAQTPTAGSSIYQYAVSTAAMSGRFFTGVSTADANGYHLETDELIEGVVTQSWEPATATSHSPTITVATATSYVTMAVEVAAGAGGADGAALRVKRAQGGNYSALSGTTFTWHLPTDGNLILADASTGTGTQDISSISGVTFTQHSSSPLANGAGGHIQGFHADNVTASRTAKTGTVTLPANTDANALGVLWFRDVLGAHATPLDASATCSGSFTASPTAGECKSTGNQTIAGNLDVGTITPSAGTRLCTAYIDHASGSETGMADATINFLVPYANQNGGSTHFYALDSGLAQKVSTGAVDFNFTRSATAAGVWEALGACYKAVAAARGLFLPAEPVTGTGVGGGYFRTRPQ